MQPQQRKIIVKKNIPSIDSLAYRNVKYIEAKENKKIQECCATCQKSSGGYCLDKKKFTPPDGWCYNFLGKTKV